MKKGFACLLALSLLLSCFAGAVAETTVTVVNLDHLYSPCLNKNVNLIYSRTSRDSGYRIFDLTGSPVSATAYDDMNSSYYGFTVRNADGMMGYIDVNGNVLVPTEYVDIDVYSAKWQVGITVFGATSENYDYSSTNYSTGNKTFYLIDHADVYFCGKKVGTLKRSQYTDYCEAHGDYLYLRDRDGKYHYYNSSFQESGYDSSSGSGEYDSVYKNHKYTYYHKGSGQKAFASGCTLTPDEVSRSVVENNGVLLDLQGNTIAQLQYTNIYSFYNGYARVKNKQGAVGLIDSQGREVIPCIYDDLNYDGPVLGYISAVKDGKQGFVKLSDGSEKGFVYPENTVKVYGAFALVKDLDGTTIIETAEAGVLPTRYAEVDYSYSASPTIVVKNMDGQCGVIGLYGEVVVPFAGQYDSVYDLTLSKDGSVVLGNDEVLYVIDYDLNQAIDTSSAAWSCPTCGGVYEADFAFCPKDATPRP